MSAEVRFSPPKLSAKAREVHEEAIACAKNYLVAESALLAVVLRVDALKIYRDFGEDFITPYCEKYLHLSGDIAANFVRVARKSLEVPALKIAVDEGLCVSKARVIAPVITPENQADWLEKAQLLTKAKLEREVVKINPTAPKPEKAKATGENRHRLEFEISDPVMEMQKRAQDLLSQKLGRPATLSDVQEALLVEYLRRQDPLQKAERERPLLRKRDQPQGRSPRIPASVKHAVYRRDRGECQAKLPGGAKCQKTRWVHLHHLRPKAHGGEHTPENLTTLCSFHHRLWHEKEECG